MDEPEGYALLPEPLETPKVDEAALEAEVNAIVAAFLERYPRFIFRRECGYLIRTSTGKWMPLSKRKYLALMASWVAGYGYSRRGLIHQIVSDKVRAALTERDP